LTNDRQGKGIARLQSKKLGSPFGQGGGNRQKSRKRNDRETRREKNSPNHRRISFIKRSQGGGKRTMDRVGKRVITVTWGGSPRPSRKKKKN